MERRDREAKQLREALHQAMADATDKAAAVVEERVAHEGALAALKRQVSQLQAGESAKAQRLMAALAKSDGELKGEGTVARLLHCTKQGHCAARVVAAS